LERQLAAEIKGRQSVFFGEFQLDCSTGELRRNGTPVRLQPQPAKILDILLRHTGEIVTRSELVEQVWGSQTYVDFEHGLNFAIRQIRSALQDDPDHPRFLETIPKRGYRFIASVTHVEPRSVPTIAPVSQKAWRWRVMGTAVATVVILVSVASLRTHSPGTSKRLRINSLAVLPLRNLSPDPQQEYFSDGMTDELITSVSKIPRLRVISHTSVDRYKGTKQTLPEIGRTLGVDAIVEGTVLRSGDRIRITAQLIDARTDQHLWAESYERDVRDVLLLQGEVAREIAERVGVNLSSNEPGPRFNEKAIDPAAHEAYLKGNFYWNTFTCSGFETALKYFQEATSRAPDFAPAYSGLADSYFNLADWRCWPLENLDKAQAAAQKAVELDPQSGDAHESLGSLAFYRDWDWTKADREYIKAIELAPNNSGIHSGYAIFLVAMGRRDQALGEMQKALQLDPIAEPTNLTAVYVYYLARQYDKGIEHAKKTLDLFPRSYATLYWLGHCYESKGMPDEAMSAYLQASSEAPKKASIFKTAYRKAGLKGYYAIEMELRRKEKKEIDPVIHAMSSVHMGENETAIQLLRLAYQQHCDGLQFLNSEPVYDPLRGDSRFQELVAQLRF
jgi:TolB-like protein/DNA-binding winged helix-turn-helix (wHTH) protein/Tfp pilus assembly protein PilF